MWETKKFTENKFSLINAQFGNMFHSASKKKKNSEAKNAVPVSCHQGLDRHPLPVTQTPSCKTHTHPFPKHLSCVHTNIF